MNQIEVDNSVGQEIYTVERIKCLEWHYNRRNLLFEWVTKEGDSVVVGTDRYCRAGVLVQRDGKTIRSYSGEPAEKVLEKTYRQYLKGFVVDYSCMVSFD